MISTTEQDDAHSAPPASEVHVTKPRRADELAFMSMDLKNSITVKKAIPFVDRGGTIQKVPTCIYARSANPVKAVLAIQAYRRMGEQRQAAAHKEWKEMKESEKRKYKKIRDDLIETKQKLLRNEVRWSDFVLDASKEMEVFDSQTKGNKSRKAKANAEDSADLWLSEWSAQEREKKKNAEAAKKANRNSIAGSRTSNRQTQSSGNALENTSPNSNFANVSPEGDDGGSGGGEHVGLASAPKAREAEAEKALKKAKSGNRRKKRKGAVEIHHQATSEVEKEILSLYKKVAKVNDLLHMKSVASGVPRRRILLADVSEVNNTKGHGGRMKSDSVMRKKPKVVLVGPDDHLDSAWVLKHSAQALKHEVPSTHVRVDLFRDPQDGTVETTVNNYTTAWFNSRNQTKRKGRKGQDVLDEQNGEN